MCVSSCAVRTRDVTYVMVRLNIGYGALVVGAVQCDIAHWGSVRRHSRMTRSASRDSDAERAVVVIVGWMQSTRVELRGHAGDAVMADGSTWTIGSSQRGSVTTWVRAASLARASTSSSTFGKRHEPWPMGKVARALVPYCPRPTSSSEWTRRHQSGGTMGSP